jgi:LmbE family N-acetylglucosaminyl deacetylase
MIQGTLRWALRGAYRLMAPSGMKNMLALHKLWLDRQPWPELVELPPGRQILVLAPHFDDEAIGPGGTLAKHARAGHRIAVAFMTDGRRGDPEVNALEPAAERARQQDLLVATRKAEARRAAQILGLETVHFLDAPDEDLAATPDTVAKLRHVLMEVGPDLVYVPFITDRMPDHTATNAVLMAAADDAMDFQVCAYEVWNPLYANTMVDIGSTFQRKSEAIRVYESQLRFNDYLACIGGLNAYRAMAHLKGASYAEAFYLAPLKEYRHLFAALRA